MTRPMAARPKPSKSMASGFGCSRGSESFDFSSRELQVVNIEIGVAGVKSGDQRLLPRSAAVPPLLLRKPPV